MLYCAPPPALAAAPRETEMASLPPRIPPVLPDVMSEAQRAVAARIAGGPRGGVRGPFLALLQDPELADRVQQLGEFIRYGTGLPKTLSELAILVAARRWGCQYEWFAHAPIAREVGVDPTVIEAIAAGRAEGRQSDQEITCFHNFQGLGLQFAALGSLVYREAKKRKIGLELDDRLFTQSIHP